MTCNGHLANPASITFRYVHVTAAVDSDTYRAIQIGGRRIYNHLVVIDVVACACERTDDVAARDCDFADLVINPVCDEEIAAAVEC